MYELNENTLPLLIPVCYGEKLIKPEEWLDVVLARAFRFALCAVVRIIRCPLKDQSPLTHLGEMEQEARCTSKLKSFNVTIILQTSQHNVTQP